PAQEQAQNSIVDTMRQTAADTGDAQLAESAAALHNFMQQQSAVEANGQLLITLDSLQVLARYLEGIPGRKNLIWFLGTIPTCDPSVCPYEDLIHETQNRLAAARVSVYPINAGGVVAPDADMGNSVPGGATSYQGLMNAQDSERGTADKAYGF